MLLRAWILFCAGVVAAGWILSAFRALAPAPLGVALAGVAAVLAWQLARAEVPWRREARKLARRLGRVPSLPWLYAVSLALLLLRALLYPPWHDDGLCYRIPRAMAWIMDRGLTWIEAQDPRLDTRGTVSEWLSVPILMAFRAERLVFLPNFISTLFLPGLIFAVWRRLGMAPRVAWLCMWLLPTGFCFALQAFNTSNDSIAAVFVLASFELLFRARESWRWGDFAVSLVALALASGVKLNCLPLALPWLALALPLTGVARARPAATLGVLALAALVSFLPTGLLNLAHGGGFSGLRLESELVAPPVLVAIFGNIVLIAMQNTLMTPPLYPTFLIKHISDAFNDLGISQMMYAYFQPPVFSFYTYVPVQQAGLGYLVLLALAFIWGASRRDWPALMARERTRRWTFLSLTALAFLQFLAAAYTDEPARIMCVYYLLLTPLPFIGGAFLSARLFRISRVIVGLAMVCGLYYSLLDTENPLFGPAGGYKRMAEENRLVAAAAHCFPASPGPLGIVRRWNQRESWLWQPYGERRVVEFSVQVAPGHLQADGVRYVAVSQQALDDGKLTLDAWLARTGARLLGRQEEGDHAWYFVEVPG